MSPTIFWYDYETFGADPRRDRPVQFAGVRTDLELNIVDDPIMMYCRPADDYLPHPKACLITGITPQVALERGVPEVEFIGAINDAFSQPQTCVAGYNNLRFDDEVTRHTLYRNFFDAYAREWQNSNSRWDIIDVVRLTHALRPEGIEWPFHDDGKPSFRLEDLTTANGIEHGAAHDALADVYATIAIAKLIRQRQPRLYDYVFEHRVKQQVSPLLDVVGHSPVLHVSAMYSAELGCIAYVMPLAGHPLNKNEVIVYDLRNDPEPFLALDVDALSERLFTRQDALLEGVTRLPVKTIHINKAPIVVPTNTLTRDAAERWQIDPAVCERHRQLINAHPDFVRNLIGVYSQRNFEAEPDPDFKLYDGGFFSNGDKQLMAKVRRCAAAELADEHIPFSDKRLPEMLFRFRARNYPDTLTDAEKQRWREFRRARLLADDSAAGLSVDGCRACINELRQYGVSNEEEKILGDVEAYVAHLQATLNE